MRDKITLARLKQMKRQREPIAMLTCYDYSTAVLLEEAGVDCLLVGDSLSQVILGYKSSLQAKMDIMVALTGAVRRGAPTCYLIGDMPFLSYQVCTEDAIRNAGRFLIEAECDAVKMEVDRRHTDLVAALARAGMPVMAHMGFRPQAIHQTEQIVTARLAELGLQLLEDARAMVKAGACSILLECVTAEVSQAIADRLDVPVISCGSGPACDAQVMVLHELLGLPGALNLKFTKRYADLSTPIQQAARQYVQDVREKRYPDSEHCYHMKPDQLEQFHQALEEGSA